MLLSRFGKRLQIARLTKVSVTPEAHFDARFGPLRASLCIFNSARFSEHDAGWKMHEMLDEEELLATHTTI